MWSWKQFPCDFYVTLCDNHKERKGEEKMNKFNKATKLFVSVMMVVSTLSVPIYSSRVVFVDGKDNSGTTTKPDVPATDDKTDTPSTPTTNVEVKTEGNVPTVSLDTNKEELVKILVESGALTKEE